MPKPTFEELVNLRLNGELSDSVIEAVKKQANKIQSEHDKRQTELAEEHRKKQEIRNKPENCFPELWNLHKIYPQELADYCESYDLKELEAYAKGLETGLCQSTDFRNGSGFAAFGYLNGKIKERKINQNRGASGTSKPEVDH